VRLELAPDFRYIHEPLTSDEPRIPFLGNADLLSAIKQRIVHSRGGSFLITGFRGVGKTTLVARALEEISREEASHTALVSVSLSVARPMSIDQLLFAIVRRTFESLEDKDIFARLNPEVQRSLLLAYMRTSLSFKETRANSFEQGNSIGIGGTLPASAGAAAMVFNALAPKLNLTSKRTSSLATEASFLAYSDTDVEHDVLRIVGLLHLQHEDRSSFFDRFVSWLGLQKRAAPKAIRLVVVLDELDKLTTTEGGLENVEQLLNGLKNVLTTPGVHFIFVGGPDLHDKVLRDSSRGNGLYESVFGWQLYVPCIWKSPETLIERLTPETSLNDDAVLAFQSYLKFKARGIPRRLFQEFNAYVAWDGDRPLLSITDQDNDRIRFYASLEDNLAEFFGLEDRERIFPVRIDEDRLRLSAYYVLDWILRSKGRQFAADEISEASKTAEIDPLFRMSDRVLERLLQHLVQAEVLEKLERGGPKQAIFEDAPRAQAPMYQLSEQIGRQLFGFAYENERERADLNVSDSVVNVPIPPAVAPSAPPVTWGSLPASAPPRPSSAGAVASATGTSYPVGMVRTLKNGRYELGRLIGTGGMGSVYKGLDKLLNRRVAVKVLHPTFSSDEIMKARFVREAQIATKLSHPHIVETYEVVSEGDSLGIVMQYLDGPTLSEVLARHRYSATESISICSTLVDVLQYLDSKQVFRLDLKPRNVIMVTDLSPIVVDLGLAKRVIEIDSRLDFNTLTGVMVGTPTYMAPEQFQGQKTDIRTDIYSLGLILAELLLGSPVRTSDDLYTIMNQVMNEQVDLSSLNVSDELKSLTLRATAKNPDDRFQSPAEMRDELKRCPEYASSHQAGRTITGSTVW
jgi:tRNA A-37 threonylcarbamoyl transferase component Bud32